MTIDQALQLASALTEATRKAIQTGHSIIDLTSELQAADDAARSRLDAAIDSIQRKINAGNQ